MSEQLLEGEILHERNVILQCVYYIVQQNFFGIGQPAAAATGELHDPMDPAPSEDHL